jgi:hypothetical protein
MDSDSSDVALLEKDDSESSQAHGRPVSVERLLWTLTNEAPLRLIPILALQVGLVPGLFLSQVAYWLNKTTAKHHGLKVVRWSYSGWQRQLAFLSRSQIFNIVAELEKKKAITVVRGKGVIRIGPNEVQLKPVAHEPQKNKAALLVFPTLAKVIGLREALILQQVHIRTYHDTMPPWARKSIRRWHDDCLKFIPLRTLERCFASLIREELLIAKRMDGPGGGVNAYKIHYDKLKVRLAGQTTENPVIDWKSSMTKTGEPYLLAAKSAGKAVHWVERETYGDIKYTLKGGAAA